MFNRIEITDSDKELLKKFPEYDDNKPENYVGSKDYWENIFSYETNRDTELHKAFSKLHEEIVDKVIQFCQEHNLTDVDEFKIHADGVQGSIKYGKWCPCTDSSMSMIVLKKDDETGWELPDREHPFLFQF